MGETAPEFADALTLPFWEGARRRTLMMQRCNSCGHHQFYPRSFCLRCRDDSVEWVAVSGRGTVYTRTIIRRAASPDRAVPYVNALVDLDEGPRLFTSLTSLDIGIGDPVELVWQERGDAPPLPVFGPAGG